MKDKEKEEVERLVASGFPVELTYTVTKRKWYGKKYDEVVKKTYMIEEPTLGTLDRICKYALDIELNEPEYAKLSEYGRAKMLVSRYTMTACRIIATAIIGTEYRELIEKKGRTSIHELDYKVESLASIIYHSVKPSELKKLTYYITATQNIADFCSSITLMSVERTTKPNVVEEEAEA